MGKRAVVATRKGPDEFHIDLGEITKEAAQYVKLLKDSNIKARRTKLYRFARAIGAYEVLVRGMEEQTQELDRKYKELEAMYHKLGIQTAEQIRAMRLDFEAKIAQLEERFELKQRKTKTKAKEH